MSGGNWLSQTKVRPGAYLNFVSVPRAQMTIGDRGIMIIPLPLSWGAQGELIEVLSTDMLTGASTAKVGFTAFDAASKVLNLGLQNCYKALVYRTNSNGVKASATLADLTATARHAGLLGNRIQVSIVELETENFEVKTFLDARQVNMQTVAEIQELQPNDFVVFSGTGELEEHAGEPLSGGTDGTDTPPSTWFDEFLDLATMARWQTMAVPIKDATISKNVLTFINDQRNNQGRYVQAVVCDYPADHEGIINNINGAVIDSVNVSPAEFTSWVAGATAGATITQSNTNRVVIGATDIIGELDNGGIIQALRTGKFVLSRRQDGSIKVENDINSFTSWTLEKDEAWSLNQVVRIMDEIGITVTSIWERSYMGKVPNNPGGRANFKGDLIEYFNEMQRIEALQDFAGSDDITVAQGVELYAVVVDWRAMPVVAMTHLYMTTRVRTN